MFLEPHEIAIPAPAAGQGFSYQVQGAYVELPLSIAFTLVASAVAGNRTPLLSYVSPGGQTLARFVAASSIGTGITGLYSYALGWPTSGARVLGVGTLVETQLAIVPLRPGGRLVLTVDAMDAGDVISEPIVSVTRYDLTGRGAPAERVEVDLVQAPPGAGSAGGLS